MLNVNIQDPWTVMFQVLLVHFEPEQRQLKMSELLSIASYRKIKQKGLQPEKSAIALTIALCF